MCLLAGTFLFTPVTRTPSRRSGRKRLPGGFSSPLGSHHLPWLYPPEVGWPHFLQASRSLPGGALALSPRATHARVRIKCSGDVVGFITSRASSALRAPFPACASSGQLPLPPPWARPCSAGQLPLWRGAALAGEASSFRRGCAPGKGVAVAAAGAAQGLERSFPPGARGRPPLGQRG